MDRHHRKIDLQSPLDFTYLLNNIERAAREKIDLALPPSTTSTTDPEDEAYRSKVSELVNAYILETLKLALPNLSINGFDAPPSLLNSLEKDKNGNQVAEKEVSEEEVMNGNYETYDPRLAEKLRTLYMQYEAEAEDVARLRREAPKKAAERYAEALAKVLEGENGDLDVEQEEGPRDGQENEKVQIEELKGLGERREEAEHVWSKGREGAEGLERITGVIGRLEQAQRAIETVEGR